MEVVPRPKLFDFHGVWMTHYFTDNWENVQNFQARPDDIVIASYSKAGTNWISYIIDLLHFAQKCPDRDKTVPIYKRVVSLEFTSPSPLIGFKGPSFTYRGTDELDKQTLSPRLMMTHLPIQFIPKSFWEQNCKIVYVARNPKDTMVSFFHFQNMTQIYPEAGEWSSYHQGFMEGKTMFGSWYDHVNGWWEKKQTYPNLHYMFYEDLVEDKGREIDKLCSFFGLSPSAEEKEMMMRKVAFEEMKKNNLLNYSKVIIMDKKKSSFMRKGKVGDWKNHFTVAQNEAFDEHYQEKMKNSTLQFRTEL